MAFADSQAAMLCIQNDTPGPRQASATQTIQLADTLHGRGDTVTVRWVPGHKGVTGNEVAGLHARRATEPIRTSRNDRGRAETGDAVRTAASKRRRTESDEIVVG